MSTKKQFTPEEIRHLRANPYTRCVTADTISYTLAFKEAFWALCYQKSNKLAAKSKGSVVVFSTAISEGEPLPELCGKAAESCTYPQHDPYFLSMPLSIPGM